MTSLPRQWSMATVVAGCIVGSTLLAAIHVMQEIRKVPVQRLARNLEHQLTQKPDDLQARLNLARLHAMAYALKVTEMDARGPAGKLEPFYGFEPPHLPGPVRPGTSREHDERAKVDLVRAVRAYADVVARAPTNAIARLGYAWTLEQSGQQAGAIVEYRKAVELAWPADRKEDAFLVDSVTQEAAERLTELLDSVKDAREIASLEEKLAALQQKGRLITPIAVPLGNVGGTPLDPEARVLFDADGSGIPQRWTWVRSDAAWLVYDADGSGQITSALQWFGNVTFWLFWNNGYEALRGLDDNSDGELRGPELRSLALWHDLNSNGYSDTGEVRPLSAHGIVALSCDYSAGDHVTVEAQSRAGVIFADGSTRPTYDVILRRAGRRSTTLLSAGALAPGAQISAAAPARWLLQPR